ncbi:unnamed protein product [Penicillium palitans]
MSEEHTRDWETLLPAQSPTGPIDQAFQLPQTPWFILYQFRCVLERPSDYPIWRNHIYQILKVHRLHLLIDSGIDRPYKDSPDARRWQELSIEVRKWISWNLNPIFVRMIVKEAGRAELADEFMSAADNIIQELARGPEHPEQDYAEVSDGLFNLIRCKRSDYSNARQFVHRLMEYYTHTLNMRMGIPPFVPLLLLLDEIKDDNDIGERFVNLRGMNNVAQNVTREYFENVYFDVLDHLDSIGQTAEVAFHQLTDGDDGDDGDDDV